MAEGPKSIFLIVGFTEGGWHVRRFEKSLKRRGFTITKDVAKAHFVVAHSGGCYTIPPLSDEQVLMLINPTYWPGKALNLRGGAMTLQLLRAVRPGNNPLYHLWKTIHNLFYLFYHHRLNMVMVQQSRWYSLEQSINHHKTILVRNQNDPWLTHELDDLQRLHPKLKIERLAGDHDDCWLNPGPYIDLLLERTW